MPGGRPTTYTPELADEICTRLAEGESLRAICRDNHTPSVGTVLRWVGENKEFQDHYARAREVQAETLADEIVSIADDSEEDSKVKTARDRLRVDSRKWVASKLLPKKYGDKLDLNHGAQDSLMDLMKAVDGRARGIPTGG